MYITLKISAQTFEAVCAAMADSRNSDYYNTPAGASSKLLPANTPAPIVAIADRRAVSWLSDNSIRHGYTVSDCGAMYSTCYLNIHGVFRNEAGEHLAFYWGRRSRVHDLTATLLDVGVEDSTALPVLEYKTEGPADMKWWENRTSYTLRQDDLSLAAIIASTDWDANWSEWCKDVLRHLRHTPERLARVQKLAAIASRSAALSYRREQAMA